MSLPKTVFGTCSKCGKSTEITVWDSINTDLQDDVPQKIISGELFKTICPHCGANLEIEYPTLYHDMKHNVMIKIMSNSDSPQSEIDEINEALGGLNGIFKGYTTRLVKNTRDLREKVEIIEAGLNDKVIEILKLVSFIQIENANPNFEIQNCFFEIRNGDKTICFYDKKGNCIVAQYNEEGYINAERALQANKRFSTQSFEIVDINWARKMVRDLYEINHPESSNEVQKGTATLRDSVFRNEDEEEGIANFDKQKEKYVVCIFDAESGSLRREIREINTMRFPPSKYAINDTYYAIEKIREGKRIRIYCEKSNWDEQVQNRIEISDSSVSMVRDASKKADMSFNNKKRTVRYCKMCGGKIDAETKRCKGCGKQYFKGVKFNKYTIALLIIAFVLLINKDYIMDNFVYNATIIKDEINLEIDDVYKIQYDTNFDNIASKINWKSSDSSIASVSNKGNVTAKNEGSARIEILINDVVKDSCIVNVSLEPVFVQNGEMIVSPQKSGSPEVTVNAPQSANCYVYLKNVYSEKNSAAFYVKAGSSATVNVPAGTYELYYATGQTWYGREHKFGKGTSYSKSNEYTILSESYSSYDIVEFTLYAVPNGNMHTEDIEEFEFPD